MHSNDDAPAELHSSEYMLPLVFVPHNLDKTSRSRERYRRAALTSMASLLARGLALAAGLISVPLAMKYLGRERYGLWMLLTSIVMSFTFADFGVGSGLINLVSEAYSKHDPIAARRCISSAFYVVLCLSALILALFSAVYPIVPWVSIFHISNTTTNAEWRTTLVVLVACFVVGLPLGLIQKVQSAFQDGFSANLWQIAGSVLSFLGILLAIKLQLAMPWLVFTVVGAPLFASAINWIVYKAPDGFTVRPRISDFNIRSGYAAISLGGSFTLIQLSAIVMYSIDGIIAGHLLGPSAVARYAVAQRAFILGPALQGIFLAPLWPAYTEATARGDNAWIRNALSGSVLLSIAVTGIVGLIVVIFRAPLFTLWIGHSDIPSLQLSCGLAVWGLVSTVGGALSIYLNAVGELRLQRNIALAFVFLGPVLKFASCSLFGLPGLAWATSIAYALIALPLLFTTAIRRAGVFKRLCSRICG